jgi:hypothetical protein
VEFSDPLLLLPSLLSNRIQCNFLQLSYQPPFSHSRLQYTYSPFTDMQHTAIKPGF